MNWSNLFKGDACRLSKKSTRKEKLNTIKKVSAYSQKETSAYNTVGVKNFLTDIENTENSNSYAAGIDTVVKHAKNYKENGKSPLLTLID